MGMRGPQGKPTALKILEGNPNKEKLRLDFIEPDGDIKLPEDLTGYAAEVWCRVVGSMPPGIYKQTDGEILKQYCLAAGRCDEAQKMLELEGQVLYPVVRTYEDENNKIRMIYGKAYRNPWGVIQREAAQQIHRLGMSLGLDPVSRENIKDPKKKKPGKFTGLIGAANDAG